MPIECHRAAKFKLGNLGLSRAGFQPAWFHLLPKKWKPVPAEVVQLGE